MKKLTDILEFVKTGKLKVDIQPVDLGLPSGTLWGDRNVGATDPADDGLYFQWGYTDGYRKEETFNNHYDIASKTYTSECPSGYDPEEYGRMELRSADDAATANLSSSWSTPTRKDFEELFENTTWDLTIRKNKAGKEIDGVVLKSKINGNELFIPECGLFGISLRNRTFSFYTPANYVHLWTSTLRQGEPGTHNSPHLASINTKNSNFTFPFTSACTGYPIRAIKK